ncbi:MAG: hypothetical protein V1717_00135 [Candidatus Micrarchaeota archaeon]
MSSAKTLALLPVLLAVLIAGCVGQTPSATPSATSTPTPLPTVIASPTSGITVEIPSPEPEEKNYSKEEVVSGYLTALAGGNFEKAYSFVSREFKREDPAAASAESFSERVSSDYPPGFVFQNVSVVRENPREVLAWVLKPNATRFEERGFVLSFESGFWKIRVPFATPGKYYNDKTSFVFNTVELSRFFERAFNDFLSTLDPAVKNKPLEFGLFDMQNKVYYVSEDIVIISSSAERSLIHSVFDFTLGPSFVVQGFGSESQLGDRPFVFEFTQGSRSNGGNGGFFCYRNSRNYFASLKMDSGMANFYSNETNPLRPVLDALSKACPP